MGPKWWRGRGALRKLPGVGPSWGAGPEPHGVLGAPAQPCSREWAPRTSRPSRRPAGRGPEAPHLRPAPGWRERRRTRVPGRHSGEQPPVCPPGFQSPGRGPGTPRACGLGRESRAAPPPFGWSLTSECDWTSAGDLEAKLPAARGLEELPGSESEVPRCVLRACDLGPLPSGTPRARGRRGRPCPQVRDASEAALSDGCGFADMFRRGREWAVSPWVLGIKFPSGSLTPRTREPHVQ